MKNHGADDAVNAMFDMGTEMMALPLEEKMKYEQGDDGYSFGYIDTILVCMVPLMLITSPDTKLKAPLLRTRPARLTRPGSSTSRRTTRSPGPPLRGAPTPTP